MSDRTCKGCGIVQPVTDFPMREVSKKTGVTLYRYKCRSCDNKRLKAFREANPEKCRQHVRNWIRNNPERQKAANKNWSERNRDKCNAIKRAWNKRNPDKCNARSSEYRARKLNATPLWADRVENDYVYHAAQVIKEVYGTTWHVDHIVPLQHDKVCGLHVANNLQLLSPTDNCRKSNTFEVG